MAFSGTRSAILAALASLLLPDGLGNLQLDQSPPQFDNSLKIATTAFLARMGMQGSGWTTVGTTQTLGVGVIGGTIQVSGSTAAITLTLPLTSAVGSQGRIEIINSSPYPATFAAQGASDKVYGIGAGAGSITVQPGDTLTLVCEAANVWSAVSGTSQLLNSSLFSRLLGTSGYQKLPSGLIIQWGTYLSSSSSDVVATFPIAFPNGALMLLTSQEYTPNSGVIGFSAGIPISASQCTFRSNTSGQGSVYMVFGW
jgi:hypothetical protein